MADSNKKVNGNIGGKYYVDCSCIGCGLCAETAAENIKMNDDRDLAFVFKQPENTDEDNACNEAKESCPVEAIGDDGE